MECDRKLLAATAGCSQCVAVLSVEGKQKWEPAEGNVFLLSEQLLAAGLAALNSVQLSSSFSSSLLQQTDACVGTFGAGQRSALGSSDLEVLNKSSICW